MVNENIGRKIIGREIMIGGIPAKTIKKLE